LLQALGWDEGLTVWASFFYGGHIIVFLLGYLIKAQDAQLRHAASFIIFSFCSSCRVSPRRARRSTNRQYAII
jgi:hypothetical protein